MDSDRLKQTYDHDYKLIMAEYATLLGRSAHCWLMGERVEGSTGNSGIMGAKAGTNAATGESNQGREALDALFFMYQHMTKEPIEKPNHFD